MRELILAATVENLKAVTDFVNEQLEAAGCPVKTQMQIDIAVDEIFCNIAQYAYAEIGEVTIRVEVTEAPLAVVITFIDHGIPYDPLKNKDPDITLPADERAIGGLGIYMVKRMTDEITYAYEDGRNILKIKKAL